MIDIRITQLSVFLTIYVHLHASENVLLTNKCTEAFLVKIQLVPQKTTDYYVNKSTENALSKM